VTIAETGLPGIHQRLARTHGDFPKGEGHAARCQYWAYEVVVADAGAANCNQNVSVMALGNVFCEALARITGDAEENRLAAGTRDEGGDT
jgi:hypothetical protein